MNKNLIKTGLISIGVSAILSTNLMAEERFLADSNAGGAKSNGKSNDYTYLSTLNCIVAKTDKTKCLKLKDLKSENVLKDLSITKGNLIYSAPANGTKTVEFEIAGVPGNTVTIAKTGFYYKEYNKTNREVINENIYVNKNIHFSNWNHDITIDHIPKNEIALDLSRVGRSLYGAFSPTSPTSNMKEISKQSNDPLSLKKIRDSNDLPGFTYNKQTYSHIVALYRKYISCELDEDCKADLKKQMKEKGYSTANLYGEKEEFKEPNENLLALIPDSNGKVSYEGRDYELNKDNGMYRGDLLCPNGDIGFYIEIYNPKIEKKMTFNSCEDGAKIGGETSFKKKEFTPKSLLRKKKKYIGARGVKNGKPIVEIESSMRKRFAIMGNFMKKDTQKEAE